MAQQTLTTNQVTFLDYTDNRKLEVYITSNLPQTQIYNPNTLTYSPDWSSTNLTLTADAFLDTEIIEPETITWFKKNMLGDETRLDISSKTLTIDTNEMQGNTTSVTYICIVTYETISTRSQITFVRSDSGINGADGTSVTIKDTAYYNGTLTNDNAGEVVVLYEDAQFTTALSTNGLSDGDAYIVQGYLCVYNSTKNGFVCTGEIRGPQGESAKNIILNTNAHIFRINDKQEVFPTNITITGQGINTTISDWSYSVDGGYSFLSLSNPPSYISKTGDQLIIYGKEMTVNTVIIKASDGEYSDVCTIYKVLPGQPAATAFLTNENITFSADAQGRIAATTIFANVVGYSGNNKVLPIIGEVIDAPDGMSITSNINELFNEVELTISVANNSNLGTALSHNGIINIPVSYPISSTLQLSWSKINTGATGASGVDAITFQIYSADGYVLSKETPFIQLKTFAYNGDVPIDAGASFQWYQKLKTVQYERATANGYDEFTDYYIKNASDEYSKKDIASAEIYSTYFGDGANASIPLYVEIEWTKLTEERTEEIVNETTGETTMTTVTALATLPYVTIHHKEISFSTSYMCKMTFNGVEYVDVVTIDDKNDTNTVFTSKPKTYSEGDIWIVGNDYAPVGVEVGTVLKAQHASGEYNDSHWVIGTKYDDKLNNLETTVGTYQQYISLDTTTGITMNAVNADGKVSEFSTSLSNTELAFKQGDEKVAYINNHKMHITEAEIESPLTVTGKYSGSTMVQAPTINLGSFSFVIESNGSLSIASNL